LPKDGFEEMNLGLDPKLGLVANPGFPKAGLDAITGLVN
jgi:hypothetical protein